MEQLQQLRESLNIIPYRWEGKRVVFPADWGKYRTEKFTGDFWGDPALLCTDDIVCIDVDCKYDLTGFLFSDLMDEISNDDELLPLITQSKLYIESTKSKGYHIIFRCPGGYRSTQLAQRPTIETEKKDENDRTRVLIETRAEGGLIFIAPSKGYEVLQGSLLNLPILSYQTAERLMAICRKFDQMPAPKIEKDKVSGSMADRFCDDNSIETMLLRYGWKFVYERGNTKYWTRPGKEKGISGASCTISGREVFHSFSSSVPSGLVGKSVTAFRLMAEYEHNGNMNLAARSIADKYGDKEKRDLDEESDEYLLQFIQDSRYFKDSLKPSPPPAVEIVRGDERFILSPVDGAMAVTGQRKGGKSSLVMGIIASAFVDGTRLFTKLTIPKGKRLIYIDTEQDEYWHKEQQKAIERLAGVPFPDWYEAYNWVKLDFKQLKRATELLVAQGNIGCVIIDNIGDYILDDNALVESKAIVNWFTKKLVKKESFVRIAIAHSILHDPKSPKKSAAKIGGFLGSYMEKKFSASIRVQFDEEMNHFFVSPLSMRGRRFQPFRFFRHKDGTPSLTEDLSADNDWDTSIDSPIITNRVVVSSPILDSINRTTPARDNDVPF